jgi:hypothetical protein
MFIKRHDAVLWITSRKKFIGAEPGRSFPVSGSRFSVAFYDVVYFDIEFQFFSRRGEGSPIGD